MKFSNRGVLHSYIIRKIALIIVTFIRTNKYTFFELGESKTKRYYEKSKR